MLNNMEFNSQKTQALTMSTSIYTGIDKNTKCLTKPLTFSIASKAREDEVLAAGLKDDLFFPDSLTNDIKGGLAKTYLVSTAGEKIGLVVVSVGNLVNSIWKRNRYYANIDSNYLLAVRYIKLLNEDVHKGSGHVILKYVNNLIPTVIRSYIKMMVLDCPLTTKLIRMCLGAEWLFVGFSQNYEMTGNAMPNMPDTATFVKSTDS